VGRTLAFVADVTFADESVPMSSMGSAMAVVEEHEGVEAVYRADAERLWRAVYAFAGDADIASDAVAEAFAQLLRRGTAVRDPAAWTWRTAFRISAGALKARGAGDPLPATPLEHIDRHGDPDLLAALRQLPDAQRAAVILFYYADLPIREIAARLGSNGLAVRANLSRGRRRLRELLGDNDG
jgi:RNA polymerase sigma-70 factor (ECF subfamily)